MARTKRSIKDVIQQFTNSVWYMGRFAYDAAPRILIGSLSIRVLLGIMPAIAALIAKLIFDLIGSFLQDDASISFQADMLPIILLFGGTLVVTQGLTALDAYFTGEMTRRVNIAISKTVYGHILTLTGMTYFESPKFHDTLREAASNAQWSPANLIQDLTTLLRNGITLISFFGIIFFFNPMLALILVIATVPQFWVQRRFRIRRFHISWSNNAYERQAYYYARLLSEPMFAKELRLFNLGNYILDKFITKREYVNEQNRKLQADETRANVGLSIVTALVMVGTYIAVIGQVFASAITIGDVALYIEVVRGLQGTLQNTVTTLTKLSASTMYFAHYQTLMAMTPELEQYEYCPVKRLQHKIEMQNVSFRYEDNSPYVLKNINLTIHKNESLALVGLNGAGKTTIVKLLSRFYDPTEGSILWDGVDIRHFDPIELRERLGAVLQDFVRYDMTVQENIGLGNLQHIDDQSRIQHAAQDMGIHQFIEDLPNGYNTVLSKWLVGSDEQGTDLSGGQWQKIAISRAYMRDVDMLMLDEPTAALDAEAEHDIYERFAELTANKASLLISHRFSTVRMANKIAVIDGGTITEYGTHEDLIAQDGEYARLYGLQAKQYV